MLQLASRKGRRASSGSSNHDKGQMSDGKARRRCGHRRCKNGLGEVQFKTGRYSQAVTSLLCGCQYDVWDESTRKQRQGTLALPTGIYLR
jgi:hypothetical protein